MEHYNRNSNIVSADSSKLEVFLSSYVYRGKNNRFSIEIVFIKRIVFIRKVKCTRSFIFFC